MNRQIRSIRRGDALSGAVARFRRSEEGSLTIFGLIMFMMMLVAGGIALDVMRSEVERTEMQYAIDRAVLAAANLEQKRDPEAVVKDYLRAAGLDEDSVTVTTEVKNRDRRVAVSTMTRTSSLFLDMLGIDELVQPISTEAREVRTELELSLVLDISGSMGGTKLDTMRSAASTFVKALLEGREDLTTVSLVPYNDRVNAGTLAAGIFDFTEEHAFSNCIVFADEEFGRVGQLPGTKMQRMGHFDFNSSDTNVAGLVPKPNCLTTNYGAILPWSSNIAELQSRIAQLNANGNTAMDLGVKWGAMLLDPSSRDELAEMTTSAEVKTGERVNPIFVGRPVSYTTESTRKVLVVMTDGENTDQWGLKNGRRSGDSGIWVSRECAAAAGCGTPTGTVKVNLLGQDHTVNYFGTNGARCGRVDEFGRIVDAASGNSPAGQGSVTQFQRNRNLATVGLCRARFDDLESNRYKLFYSVWVPEKNAYWVKHLDTYQPLPYGDPNAVRLTYPQLFGSVSMKFLSSEIFSGDETNGYATTRDHYVNAWEITHKRARADANLSRICAAARAQGIVIYTIAFQAPSAGRSAMRNCAGAGNESRYFDVEGLDIAQAFNDVLASVSRLRLTQ